MSRLKRFFMNTIILTLTSFFMRSIGMSFSVYISSLIGSKGTGLFELIMSVYLFCITLSNSGISLATTRIVAEELESSTGNGTKIAMKKCIRYSLFFGILAGILLALFAPIICHSFLQDQIQPTPFYFIAISLPFSSITTSLTGYFAGVRRIFKTSFSQILSVFFKFFFSLYFLRLIEPTNIELACTLLILANTLSEIIDFLFLYLLYRFDLKKIVGITFTNKNYLKKILAISLPVAVTSYVRSRLIYYQTIFNSIATRKTW